MTFLKNIAWLPSDNGHLVLPGDQGQLNFQSFQGGAMLMTSAIEVSQPTEIAFPHDDYGIHISAQYFLSGEAEIVLGDGTKADWAQDGASIIRSDTPGFRLRLEPGQAMRHVCVGLYRDAVLPHLVGSVSARLDQVTTVSHAVDMAVPVPSDAAVRRVAEDLYKMHGATGIGKLKAEGLAISFFSEVLDRYASLDPPASPGSRIEPWQIQAVRTIRAAIDAEPSHAFAPGEIFERFHIGEHAARRIFQAEFGVSMAAHARNTMLKRARDMLALGTASVKDVSFSSGYAHVGNFTRAYKQAFGEAPSATRRRMSKR